MCSDTSSLQIVSVSKNTMVQVPGFGRTEALRLQVEVVLERAETMGDEA